MWRRLILRHLLKRLKAFSSSMKTPCSTYHSKWPRGWKRIDASKCQHQTVFSRQVILQNLVTTAFYLLYDLNSKVNSNTRHSEFLPYNILRNSWKSSVTFGSSAKYPRLSDIEKVFWPKFSTHRRRQLDWIAPNNYPSLDRQLPEKEINLALADRDLKQFQSWSPSVEELVRSKGKIEENGC